jgi:hypothetical protein
MTDRELLEKAAKAEGHGVEFDDLSGLTFMDNQFTGVLWNPLHNDGDALRLAVKLRIDLSLWMNIGSVTAKTYIGAGRGISLRGDSQRPQNDHTEQRGTDPYAATRRAIVRAAAAIGDAA